MSLDKFGRTSHPRVNYATHHTMSLPVSFTPGGDIDCKNRLLCNVKDPHSKSDASNKKYIDEIIQQIKNDVQTEFNTSSQRMSTLLNTQKKHFED